jgi:hypothetical protein
MSNVLAPNVPHFAQDVSSKRNSPASQRIPQKHNGAAKSHSRQWRQVGFSLFITMLEFHYLVVIRLE